MTWPLRQGIVPGPGVGPPGVIDGIDGIGGTGLVGTAGLEGTGLKATGIEAAVAVAAPGTPEDVAAA